MSDNQTKPDPVILQRAGFRPMPVLTLLSAVCLAILIMLGQWQWDKFVLKSKAPVPAAANAPQTLAQAIAVPNPEYVVVSVSGTLDPRSLKVSAVQDGIRGYRLFSFVAGPDAQIWVDRGFVGEADIARVIEPTGQRQWIGVLRQGAKANSYTLDNDAAGDVWYWPDISAMSATLGVKSASALYYVAQSTVDPLGTGKAVDNPYTNASGANRIKPETHLGYALTWWGFGLALIGVYIGMHVRAGRLRFRGQIFS
jgi:surfeit locus 1 family protein